MTLDKLKPAETKELDISEYFEGEKVVIKLKHYSNWQRNEILSLMTSGQEYDEKTGKVVFKNTGFQTKLFFKELLYGVAEAPFEWTEKTIQEIDEKNPDLLAYIHSEVQKYNVPFGQMK